ncbi:hypothetical protein [Pseudomonas xanthosomatis]|uniref:hypothetical protein n=1 Tax=Pseudomonas xanthosomatis TaxID=2842356 RepID=UPI00351350A4
MNFNTCIHRRPRAPLAPRHATQLAASPHDHLPFARGPRLHGAWLCHTDDNPEPPSRQAALIA